MLAFPVAAHADAVDPGDLLGLLAVGAPHHVAVVGAAGAEDALELQAGVDVGVLAVAVGREIAGVEGLEPRGQDDAAHLQGDLFILLLVVDGPGRAGLGADAAVAGEHVHAVGGIDDRLLGHCLGVGFDRCSPGPRVRR